MDNIIEFDWSLYKAMHQKNRPEDRFKIGDLVTYIGDSFPECRNSIYEIAAVNVMDEDSIE